MASQEASEYPAFFTERVFPDVVKRLYPRLALFEALAKFKDGPQRRANSNDEICEARRDFLDSFAYLCDTQKGGASVTAAALQKLRLSNILCLAANEGIHTELKIYAENILRKLKEVGPDLQKAVADDIFQLAVEKCSGRVEFYKDEMQKHARKCHMQLRQETRSEIGVVGPI
jgi:hypothetical protein